MMNAEKLEQLRKDALSMSRVGHYWASKTLQVLSENAILRGQLFEANEAMERVFSKLMFDVDERDPEYGWPVGEFTTELMADAIIAVIEEAEVTGAWVFGEVEP